MYTSEKKKKKSQILISGNEHRNNLRTEEAAFIDEYLVSMHHSGPRSPTLPYHPPDLGVALTPASDFPDDGRGRGTLISVDAICRASLRR